MAEPNERPETSSEERRPQAARRGGPDVVYGAAGRAIQRRELLKRGCAGLTVVWIGAQATEAQVPKKGAPPKKREPPGGGCGSYRVQGGPLIPDANCGIASAADGSCGKSVTQGATGPVGMDYQCSIVAADQDCAKAATSTGFHGDSNCTSLSVDQSCGPAYAPGETMSDHDCHGTTAEDADCGLPKIGGGAWQDG